MVCIIEPLRIESIDLIGIADFSVYPKEQIEDEPLTKEEELSNASPIVSHLHEHDIGKHYGLPIDNMTTRPEVVCLSITVHALGANEAHY